MRGRDAGSAIRMLDRFAMTGNEPSPEMIEDLPRARDARLAQYRAAHPASDVLEDRSLQVTSEMPVDFLAQIRAIESALKRQP